VTVGSFADWLVPITASRRDWTLVTRNVKDLARTGIRLLNPFDDLG
jgi:hypothetical protein